MFIASHHQEKKKKAEENGRRKMIKIRTKEERKFPMLYTIN